MIQIQVNNFSNKYLSNCYYILDVVVVMRIKIGPLISICSWPWNNIISFNRHIKCFWNTGQTRKTMSCSCAGTIGVA